MLDNNWQEIKELVATTCNFEKYLRNLKYTVKQACIFRLILLGIPSNLILSVKNRGSGGGGLGGGGERGVT